MFSLILIVIIGLGMALFAQQNTQTVQVIAGNYAFSSVPVYIIAVVSVLIGLVVAWIVTMMNFFSNSLLLRQKDGVISKEHSQVELLEHELQEARVENAKLRGEIRTPRIVQLKKEDAPGARNLLSDIKERLATPRRSEAVS